MNAAIHPCMHRMYPSIMRESHLHTICPSHSTDSALALISRRHKLGFSCPPTANFNSSVFGRDLAGGEGKKKGVASLSKAEVPARAGWLALTSTTNYCMTPPGRARCRQAPNVSHTRSGPCNGCHGGCSPPDTTEGLLTFSHNSLDSPRALGFWPCGCRSSFPPEAFLLASPSHL